MKKQINPLIFIINKKAYKIGTLHLKINSVEIRKIIYYLELFLIGIIQWWIVLHEEELEMTTPMNEEEIINEENLFFNENYFESVEEIFENPNFLGFKKKTNENKKRLKKIINYEYKYSWENYPYFSYEGAGKETENDSLETREDEYDSALKEYRENSWTCYLFDFYYILLFVVWCMMTNSHFWLIFSFVLWIYFLTLILDSIILILLLTNSYILFIFLFFTIYFKNDFGPMMETKFETWPQPVWEDYMYQIHSGVLLEEEQDEAELMLENNEFRIFTTNITKYFDHYYYNGLEPKTWLLLGFFFIIFLVLREIQSRYDFNRFYDYSLKNETLMLAFLGMVYNEYIPIEKKEKKDNDFTSKYFPTKKLFRFYDYMWNLKIGVESSRKRRRFGSSKTILGFNIENIPGFRRMWTTDDEIRFREQNLSYEDVIEFGQSWTEPKGGSLSWAKNLFFDAKKYNLIKKDEVKNNLNKNQQMFLPPGAMSFETPLLMKEYKTITDDNIKNAGHRLTFFVDIICKYPEEYQKENENILSLNEFELLKKINEDDCNTFYNIYDEKKYTEYYCEDSYINNERFSKVYRILEKVRPKEKKKKKLIHLLLKIKDKYDILKKETENFVKNYDQLRHKFERKELMEKSINYDFENEYPNKIKTKKTCFFLPFLYHKINPLWLLSKICEIIVTFLKKKLNFITFKNLKKVLKIPLLLYKSKKGKRILLQILILSGGSIIYLFLLIFGLIFNKKIYLFFQKLIIKFIINMCFSFDFYIKIIVSIFFYIYSKILQKNIKIFQEEKFKKIGINILKIITFIRKRLILRYLLILIDYTVQNLRKQFIFFIGFLIKLIGLFFSQFVIIFQLIFYDKKNIDVRSGAMDDLIHVQWYNQTEKTYQYKKNVPIPKEREDANKILYSFMPTNMSVFTWIQRKDSTFPLRRLHIADEDVSTFKSIYGKFPFFSNNDYIEYKYAEFYKYYKPVGKKLTIWETILKMWIPLFLTIGYVYTKVNQLVIAYGVAQTEVMTKTLAALKELEMF